MLHSIKPREEHINVAFIDDEPRVLRTLKMQFKRQYNVFATTDPQEFLKIIEENTIHVAVSDQRMPKMNGVEILRQVKDMSPCTVRVLLTGYADLSAIIASLNQGEIYRYLTKPWKTDELNDTMARAVEYAKVLSRISPELVSSVCDNTNQSGRVLLLTSSFGLSEQIQAQLGSQYHFTRESKVEDALQLLSKDNVEAFQVLIVDLDSEKDHENRLAKLQEALPFMVVVALTNQHDSGRLIRLINTRQVYRSIPKPLTPALLQASVSQAFAKHKALLAEPTLSFR